MQYRVDDFALLALRFGHHEQWDAVQCRLVITYRMTVHFTGTLTDGRNTLPGTGEQIVIPSQDRVDFDPDGKIREIEVVTDMGHTLTQMFPPK